VRWQVGELAVARALRRLAAGDAVPLWANARDEAIPFYARFDFSAVQGRGSTLPVTGRPYRPIVLDLRTSCRRSRSRGERGSGTAQRPTAASQRGGQVGGPASHPLPHAGKGATFWEVATATWPRPPPA